MRDLHAGLIPHARRPASGLVVALAGALALAACAGGPGGGPEGPGGSVPHEPALFISPFGEPFTAAPGELWPVSDWFLGADADLDGAITFGEFSADGLRWFGRLDSDGDGRLNQPELAAYETALRALGGGPGGRDRPERGARPRGGPDAGGLGLATAQQGGPPRRGGGRGRGQGPRGYGRIADAGFFNLPQPVKAADVNIDQRVTAAEWASATERWFLVLVADGDGRLILAALPKTPLQQRAEARRR